jgi:hypothetical protein
LNENRPKWKEIILASLRRPGEFERAHIRGLLDNADNDPLKLLALLNVWPHHVLFLLEYSWHHKELRERLIERVGARDNWETDIAILKRSAKIKEHYKLLEEALRRTLNILAKDRRSLTTKGSKSQNLFLVVIGIERSLQ